MTDAVGTWIENLFVANTAALGPILLLAVCVAVSSVGWVCRGRIARWQAAAVQAAGLLMSLFVLALQVKQNGWLVDVDNAATAWFAGHRTPGIDILAVTVTNVFGPVMTSIAAVLLAVVAVAEFGSYRCGLVVIATVGGASILCSGLKVLMSRARPPTGIQEILETDYSFPSGHVTGTTALFGMLVVVLGLRRSAAVKTGLAGVAIFCVAAVALTRLYLGVHWLTDVLAGALLGAAVLAVGAATLDSLIDTAKARACKATATPRCELVL